MTANAVRALADPLVALDQDFLQSRGAVGHDPVDTEVEEALHLGPLVDRPDVDGEVTSVGSVDEALVDKDALADVGRHLDTAGCEAARASAVAGHAQTGDAGRAEGCAHPAAAQLSNAAQAPVREGGHADTVEGIAALEDLDQ